MIKKTTYIELLHYPNPLLEDNMFLLNKETKNFLYDSFSDLSELKYKADDSECSNDLYLIHISDLYLKGVWKDESEKSGTNKEKSYEYSDFRHKVVKTLEILKANNSIADIIKQDCREFLKNNSLSQQEIAIIVEYMQIYDLAIIELEEIYKETKDYWPDYVEWSQGWLNNPDYQED